MTTNLLEMSSDCDSPSNSVDIPDLLRRRAVQQGESLAFRFLPDGEQIGEELTYAELDQRSERLARWIGSWSNPGQRVLLCYRTEPAFIVAILACLRAGVIAVPVAFPRFRRSNQQLPSIAHSAQAQALLTTTQQRGEAPLLALAENLGIPIFATDAAHYETSGPPIASAESSSVAYLQFTSGTTQRPRGVIVTHANLLANCAAIADVVGPGPHAGVGWLPFTHDMGLVGTVFLPIWLGFPHTFMPPEAFLMKPRRWLEAISKYRATLSPAPNFAYELCTRRIERSQCMGIDLSNWLVAFNGAERVDARVMQQFVSAFAPCGFQAKSFLPCYGLAEATLMVTAARSCDTPRIVQFDPSALANGQAVSCQQGTELVSCGLPRGHTTLRIVDPKSQRPCPEGVVGEIWIDGPSVTHGYWNESVATVSTFEGTLAPTTARWLRSGDLGFLRDGELYVTGRLKDVIILGGRKVAAEDIEAAAETADPCIRPGGSIAFAEQDVSRERLVVIVEIPRRSIRTEELSVLERGIRTVVAQQVDVSIDKLMFVARGTLPRTTSGKKARSDCRSQFASGVLSGYINE